MRFCSSDGGAIYSDSDTDMHINGTNLSNNRAAPGQGGGAIYCQGGYLKLERADLSNNRAAYGAGLYARSGCRADIDETTFSDNENGAAMTVRDSGSEVEFLEDIGPNVFGDNPAGNCEALDDGTYNDPSQHCQP